MRPPCQRVERTEVPSTFRREHCKEISPLFSTTTTNSNPGSRTRPSLCTVGKTSGVPMVCVHGVRPVLPTGPDADELSTS